MLTVENLRAFYGNSLVLRDMSLQLERGKIYALIGPSGCGKSTLLKILCGIHRNYSGSIAYNGIPWSSANVAIGYVPQHYGLLEWKTVKDNILLPLKVGKRKNTTSPLAGDIIDTLAIGNLLHRFPNELSGGQKQRVALARTFITQPDILLMDEPFSALDALTSQASQTLFLSLWKKWNTTTLFITHNMYEAIAVGQEILIMEKDRHCITASLNNPCFGSPQHHQAQAMIQSITSALYPGTPGGYA